MYVCLIFCFLCVDTFIGIKFGDPGVCMGSDIKLAWVVYLLFHLNFLLDFLVRYFFLSVYFYFNLSIWNGF